MTGELDGIKRKDLQPCGLCKKGLLHDGKALFYRVKIQPFVADLKAIERAQGLDMLIGNPQIAAAMGPDENLANAPVPEETLLICHGCALSTEGMVHLLVGLERG